MISTKSKLWFAMFAVLGLLAAQVLGEGVRVWRDGGEQGVVNLPLCASNYSGTGDAREGWNLQVDGGVRLVLPGDMTNAVAAVSSQGVNLGIDIVEGTIRIAGADLRMLRQANIERFEIDLLDGSLRMKVAFLLAEGQEEFQVLVW